MKFFSNQQSARTGMGLYSNEIHYMLDKLMGEKSWKDYEDKDTHNKIRVRIIKMKNGKYFALVDAESLCGIKDKELFIKKAVEYALPRFNLDLSFKDIAVGGLVSDEGRLGFFSKLLCQIPPAVHEYVAFKMEGESSIHIEDPRTGIFESYDKFQSKVDNQVCCFAACSLFFAAYTALERGDAPQSTTKLLSEIYNKNQELRDFIHQLERDAAQVVLKTGNIEPVIDSFVEKLTQFSLPRLNEKEELGATEFMSLSMKTR